jgi:dihydropteroate synthase
VQNTGFSTNKTLNVNGRLMNFDPPRVMGILNVTPDSFYDGGRYHSDTQMLQQAEKMLEEGADIIDIGGYSTRPGAEEISAETETTRVIAAIAALVRHFPQVVISVDTFRSTVARAAVGEGAAIINDVSGGTLDPAMFDTIAALQVPYVLMHMRGNPQTMGTLTAYGDMMKDIMEYFHKKIATLVALGVKDIVVDPGFGFAKTREQNFLLLHYLEDLHILGRPLMVGLSRKSMIWKTLGGTPEDALNGTSALHAIALTKGAGLLRVHDVKACAEVVSLVSALKQSASPAGQ